ncbi:MAG: arylsulfatase [Verrucomicrobiales bacterium]|nr:arylsulfatase [Verrucomicrobiales bacterium]
MIRRLFVLVAFLPLVLFAAPEITRPNVILMMADDMGMGDSSAYQDFTGNADEVQVATPNMERLAAMGVRFTDAHTTSSRCSPSRYGLLTGRYPWRNRLKHWVLFGAQGDPMIERDRPTLATLCQDAGYGTAMVGKWHVGLRYRRSDGTPAAAWADADLTRPLFDTPVDHGFDFARFTARSHGTSGPDAGAVNPEKFNHSKQKKGPGHLHERTAIGATGDGKALVAGGPGAYVLSELGGRHSDDAIEYLSSHLIGEENAEHPFFLYYPSPSNHSPYTPDEEIGGKPSRGASRTKSGGPMDLRHDFIYENDLILGRFIDWLETNDDPRNPGSKLIGNTIVIFTSDNGAEKDSDIATGPFRSNKSSSYEGGHRVPFLISWAAGGVGDGDAQSPGLTNATPICQVDTFATLAEILGKPLPDLRAGGKGAEDSVSMLAIWKGTQTYRENPMFAHDHKEAKPDPAIAAVRLDDPEVDGKVLAGQWKVLYDPSLLRAGETVPLELYELGSDQREENNRISEPELQGLVEHLNRVSRLHRNVGGHRLAGLPMGEEAIFELSGGEANYPEMVLIRDGVEMTILPSSGELHLNPRGLGVTTGGVKQVDGGETLTITFDRDVILQHCAIVAGNGECGGFYRIGEDAPLAIYCVDGDIDEKDQSGVLSDLGVVKKGEKVVLSSAPHYGSETPGRWRLKTVSVRALE